MKATALSLCVLGLALSACGSADDPTTPTSGIDPYAGLVEHPELLTAAVATAAQIQGMKALFISRGEQVIVARYYNGATADAAYDVQSTTKSVTSALIGIAIDEGYLESVDQPLSHFLHSAVDSIPEDWGSVTIENLLTMAAGSHVDEHGNSTAIMGPDPVESILAIPITHEPGTRFDYSNATSHLLSVVLTEATGMTAVEFARTHLFQPLGWEDRYWERDQAGYTIGAWGLNLNATNMLDFGRLYLNGGRAGDTQIVPEDWVARSIGHQIPIENTFLFCYDLCDGYGYQWWVGHDHDHDHFSAQGRGGQLAVVVPDLELVVVTICDIWEKTAEQVYEDQETLLRLVVDEIIPAVG
jgi:CubicO group peptidase (beta-lactamase class C family)